MWAESPLSSPSSSLWLSPTVSPHGSDTWGLQEHCWSFSETPPNIRCLQDPWHGAVSHFHFCSDRVHTRYLDSSLSHTLSPVHQEICLSYLESICASHLTEVFVSVAFPERSSLTPSGGARPPWSLHLSPALLDFLAPTTSCGRRPRPCASVFAVTLLLLRWQLHGAGTSSLLSTAICLAPGTQHVLNTCFLSTP